MPFLINHASNGNVEQIVEYMILDAGEGLCSRLNLEVYYLSLLDENSVHVARNCIQ